MHYQMWIWSKFGKCDSTFSYSDDGRIDNIILCSFLYVFVDVLSLQ